MSKKEGNPSDSESPNSNNKLEASPTVVDLLTQGTKRTLDSETMIKETQKRVWGSLKKGFQYPSMLEESKKFLQSHVYSRLDMVVLYVDIVGSTSMILELPEEKIAIIMSSFAQEMASLILHFNGLVLKYAGDAVIGYFVAEDNSLQAADNAVSCAASMLTMIEKGINPILNQYDYPDLMAKIGIDFGKNIVIRYGNENEKSQLDLMGPAMNIASKIQSIAKPNQILIGDDVYQRLHPNTQKSFAKIIWAKNEWHYRSRTTGDLYQVYEYVG